MRRHLARASTPIVISRARDRPSLARRARPSRASRRARARGAVAVARADARRPDADARATPTAAVDRRAVVVVALASCAARAAIDPRAARAVDLAEAAAAKEARKAALRAAAAASASSGRGESAFDTPEYGVSEESRTPNAHSRQEEGLKKAVRDNA